MNSILAMVAARVAGGAGGHMRGREAGCAAEGEELLAGNDAGKGRHVYPEGSMTSRGHLTPPSSICATQQPRHITHGTHSRGSHTLQNVCPRQSDSPAGSPLAVQYLH